MMAEESACANLKSPRTLVYANVAAYVVSTVFAYVGTTGVIGPSNAVVSATYQTLVTPDGWAFSIWGLIFVSELFFVVAQCTPWARDSDLIQKGVSWGWVSACIFQCCWTVTFAQKLMVLSTVFIACIGLSLGAVMALSALIPPLENMAVDLICRLPFILHFGWICAATALNVNMSVVQEGGNAPTQLAFAVVSAAVLFVLATHVARFDFTGRSLTAVVSAWALSAIGSNLSTPMDAESCEETTGSSDECNLISEIFDSDTLQGLRKAAFSLAGILWTMVFLLAIYDGFRLYRSRKEEPLLEVRTKSSSVADARLSALADSQIELQA